MVWFGLIWVGLGWVWVGLVWFGLVWYGMVRYGLVWFGGSNFHGGQYLGFFLLPGEVCCRRVMLPSGCFVFRLRVTWFGLVSFGKVQTVKATVLVRSGPSDTVPQLFT